MRVNCSSSDHDRPSIGRLCKTFAMTSPSIVGQAKPKAACEPMSGCQERSRGFERPDLGRLDHISFTLSRVRIFNKPGAVRPTQHRMTYSVDPASVCARIGVSSWRLRQLARALVISGRTFSGSTKRGARLVVESSWVSAAVLGAGTPAKPMRGSATPPALASNRCWALRRAFFRGRHPHRQRRERASATRQRRSRCSCGRQETPAFGCSRDQPG